MWVSVLFLMFIFFKDRFKEFSCWSVLQANKVRFAGQLQMKWTVPLCMKGNKLLAVYHVCLLLFSLFISCISLLLSLVNDVKNLLNKQQRLFIYNTIIFTMGESKADWTIESTIDELCWSLNLSCILFWEARNGLMFTTFQLDTAIGKPATKPLLCSKSLFFSGLPSYISASKESLSTERDRSKAYLFDIWF